MIKFIFATFFSFNLLQLSAQEIDYEFGQISTTELGLTYFSNYANNEAVYIYNNLNVINSIYTYHYRIKILDERALDFQKWEIPFNYRENDKIEYVIAQSYNLENGKIKVSSVNKKDYSLETLNDSIKLRKIIIPDVKVGSVIEVKYELRMQYNTTRPSFPFQYEIPVFKSKLELQDYFLDNKHIKIRGTKSDFIDLKTTGNGTAHSPHKFYYSAENVAKLSANEERLMIDFDISDGIKFAHNFKSWSDMAVNFKDDLYFLLSGQKHVAVMESFEPILNSNISESEKVKAIVNHIKDNYEVESGELQLKYKGLLIKDVFRDKIGTPSELNILAGTVFLYSQIKVEPILVSTKSYLHFIPKVPSTSNFNHFIWKYTDESGIEYFIDIRNKYAPLTLPPADIIGDLGLNFYYGEATFQDFSKNVLTKKSEYISNINITENEIISDVQVIFSDYGAVEMRKSLKENVNAEKELFPNKSISSIEWKDKNDMEKDLIAKLSYKIKNTNSEEITFNPFEAINNYKNPLNEKYEFDIEFSLLENEEKKITISIPENYTVKTIPENVNITFENGIIYKVYYNISGNKIQILSKLRFKQLIFPKESYGDINKIFEQKIVTENEQIVLIKSN